jgi:uncharacterized protein
MIYLDTSVALAHLLAEDRTPPAGLWNESLVSSRLLEFELWNRLHARGLAESHGEMARELVGRLAVLELSSTVLSRALEPFPTPVRTLDALHLASADFIRQQGQSLRVASYDTRLSRAAAELKFELYPL